MAQQDNSSPEEAAGKLDQTNVVPVSGEGPWKNSEDMWTFQNFDDMEKYGPEIVSGKPGSSATAVLVIDNEDAGLPSYQKNKHYWILENADYGSGTVALYIRHSVEYFSILVEEGSATMEQVNDDSQVEFLGAGRKKVDSFQGYPIYIRDPAIDDNRPETQTASTTGATTGTTVETTTTAKPGAAGVVTESKTTPAETELNAFGGPGRDINSLGVGDKLTPAELAQAAGAGRGNGAAEVARRRADAAGSAVVSGATGKIESSGPGPCLPQNMGSGSGSTPPSSEPYPDAILRQARAAAAAPLSALTSRLDSKGDFLQNAFGSLGSKAATATSGLTSRLDSKGATPTAPTTVTQPPSTPTSSSTAKPRPPNVYIYEPITPGFDRYDFNTGKKVYTPNGGPSRNNSGQTVTPPQSPTTMSSAASAEAAGFGSSQYGEFGPPAPLDGGIPVGTTTAATGSLLKQRQAALSGGAG